MDEMNTDWLDEFDDSVLNDTIEANDSSALTGFDDNAETSTETASPLEANETVNETENISDDFFTNFTPTINFSMARSAGPSGVSNNIDDDYGPQLPNKPSKPNGGLPGLGGGSYKDWANKNMPKDDGDNDDNKDDKDIDLDEYYGGGKTDGDDDDDDDYGSWTDKDRLEAATAVAKASGKEALADAVEYQAFIQNVEDAENNVQKKNAELEKLDKQIKDALVALNSGEGVGTEESAKAHAAMAEAADKYGENSEEYKEARNAALDADIKGLKSLEDLKNKAENALNQAKTAYNKAVDAAQAAKDKSQESFDKAQAAEKYAGTLAGEAKEAFDRAKEKQKEWEQKQKELEAAEASKAAEKAGKSDSDNNTSTGTNSAVNNKVTFDLAKTLADSGAKMTEKEYGQVADFVANHPELASIINGGLTNAEKHTIGNVIAGIQAINAGNYLTAAKEFAQGLGMTLVSAVQLIASDIYGAGARIIGIIKSFMENPNINYGSHNKDFETFEKMRAEYGDSSELQALYDTAKGTTEQKQTFDYMKDNAATNVGEYNEGLVEDVNKVVSDASRKVIHYSPYVLEAVKKWR